MERLTDAGLMVPAALEAVHRAQADGSWAALDEVEQLVEPADLGNALDGRSEARSHGTVPALRQARDPRVDQHRQDRQHPRAEERADRGPRPPPADVPTSGARRRRPDFERRCPASTTSL